MGEDRRPAESKLTTEKAYTDGGYAISGAMAPEPSTALPRRPVESEFTIDHYGNPRGGYTTGEGFSIGWQSGVLERRGAFLEEVIEACLQRLRFFQAGKFACEENADAILHFEAGVRRLGDRTRDRQERGVEGSYTL